MTRKYRYDIILLVMLPHEGIAVIRETRIRALPGAATFVALLVLSGFTLWQLTDRRRPVGRRSRPRRCGRRSGGRWRSHS